MHPATPLPRHCEERSDVAISRCCVSYTKTGLSTENVIRRCVQSLLVPPDLQHGTRRLPRRGKIPLLAMTSFFGSAYVLSYNLKRSGVTEGAALPALPVADEAEHKRVPRSARDEGILAEDIRRVPQTGFAVTIRIAPSTHCPRPRAAKLQFTRFLWKGG